MLNLLSSGLFVTFSPGWAQHVKEVALEVRGMVVLLGHEGVGRLTELLVMR